MSLVESTRQWVLTNLPYDRGDAARVAHLAGLDAHGLLVVYHNWISRLVKPQPRAVHKSKAFQRNPMAAKRANDLAQIIADIEHGRDLKKYRSRDIDRTPAKAPGARHRRDLDLMLNNWGVYHLHISSIVESDGFVKRGGPLLFVSFTSDAAYVIDIMMHGDWNRDHVLEVLASEWPHEERYSTRSRTHPLHIPSQRANEPIYEKTAATPHLRLVARVSCQPVS